MNTEQPEKKSLWQRAKTAVKGFVKHAVGYIPSGLMITGAIFGGSALLESATGMNLLGITQASAPDLIGMGLKHMALGCVISGVMGATSDVYVECKQDAAAIAKAGDGQRKTALEQGQKILKEMAGAGQGQKTEQEAGIFSGSGLPLALSAAKHLGIS